MTTITTTLNRVRSFSPCKAGWEKLLTNLGKTQADDEPLDYLAILESNGIKDTIWCMRCEWFENKEAWMKFVDSCAEEAKKHATYANANAYAYANAYANVAYAIANANATERSRQAEFLKALLA